MKQLIIVTIGCSIAITSFAAEMPTGPRGGHPPKDVKQLLIDKVAINLK